MALITWTEAQYGTKVGFADDEHQGIFARLNKLYDLTTSGAERSAIGDVLDDLICYVVDHFEHEEKEMGAKGFVGFAGHKAEHDAFVSTIADLQKKFHAGEVEVTDEVGQMAKRWLDNHISTFDFGYSEALNNQIY